MEMDADIALFQEADRLPPDVAGKVETGPVEHWDSHVGISRWYGGRFESFASWLGASVIFLAVFLSGCSDEPAPSRVTKSLPNSTPAFAPTATETPAPTPMPTQTAAPTPEPTSTPTSTQTATPTPEPTSTPTPTQTATPTPEPTSTPTSTQTATLPYEAVWRGLSDTTWLEQNKPTVASAVTSLTWVADGIDDTERQVVQGLVDIEVLYGMKSTPALANREWVKNGVDELEGSVIVRLRDLVNYAKSDGERLLRLPFLDSIEPADADTVDVLATLAAGRPELSRVVLLKPWVEDGLAEREVLVIEGLQKLTDSSEEAALLLLSLPFLRTVEDADAGTVDVLAELASGHPELFRFVLQEPWVGDGLSQDEIEALRALKGLGNQTASLEILESVRVDDATTLIALVGLAERDSQLFNAVVDRPWLDDGLDEPEAVVLQKLEQLASPYGAATLWIATYTVSSGSDSFIKDGLVDRYDVNSSGTIEHIEVLMAVTDNSDAALNEDEFLHIIALYGFSEALIPTPQLMELVMATNWYQDGITTDRYHTEPGALRALQEIANNDTELARTILGWTWIFDEQLVAQETLVLEYLSEIDELAPELVQLIASLPWLTDNIDDWEATAAIRLYELVRAGHLDFAVELAEAPWVTDGVTLMEVLFGINSLMEIAISPDTDTANPQVASQIMDLIRYPPDVVDLSLINVMSLLREQSVFNVRTDMTEHWPDRINRLLMESWFADGLDQKERVYLIAAIASEVDRLYDPYTIETKVIELPLAGPVNLWVVGHHRFNPNPPKR